jgi:hypothetical protein
MSKPESTQVSIRRVARMRESKSPSFNPDGKGLDCEAGGFMSASCEVRLVAIWNGVQHILEGIAIVYGEIIDALAILVERTTI